jgi:hypothetical protein
LDGKSLEIVGKHREEVNAQALLLEHPGRVDKAILCATTINSDDVVKALKDKNPQEFCGCAPARGSVLEPIHRTAISYSQSGSHQTDAMETSQFIGGRKSRSFYF